MAKQAAGKRPTGKRSLTDQQRRFCEGVVSGLNATDAYLAAGYKGTRAAAKVSSTRMNARPEIRTYIEELRGRAMEAAGVTAKDVLDGLVIEARDRGEGSSHSARVQAWSWVAKILGMLEQRANETRELTRLPIEFPDE